MSNKEEWRPVPSLLNRYEVSTLGRFRALHISLTRSDGKPWAKAAMPIAVRPDRDGYPKANIEIRGKKISVRVHRLVAEVFVHRPITSSEMVVDHINRCRADNRAENLRWVTARQNRFNSGLSRRNKTGVRGVSFYKRSRKWRACITVGGRYVALGHFDTMSEAASARTAYEASLCGTEAAQ